MITNFYYVDWYDFDHMLVGWLQNTMSQDVSSQLLYYNTARDLWLGARNLPSTSSKAQVIIYKSELHCTRKEGMKMEEYMAKLKTISDQLALAGSPISTEELVMHSLNGLDHVYNAIVVNLSQPNLS